MSDRLSSCSSTEDTSLWFLQGGGHSGAAARAVDWSATPVGPAAQWPTTLKTTVAMMLHARQPMFLWWGPELIQFYNDGYLPSFGQGKHPAAMGQRGRECWVEIWPIIGPQIEDVMERGVASLNNDALVPILRNGRMEEVYWSYTYSPVFDDLGGIAGTLVICTETTSRVLATRRAQALHALLAATARAASTRELLEQTASALKETPSDIPCVIVAECLAGTGSSHRVLISSGLRPGAAQTVVDSLQDALGSSADGPVPVNVSGQLLPVDAPSRLVAPQVDHFYVAPVPSTVPGRHHCIAFGLNSALPWNEDYRTFLDQVAAHYRTAAERIEETTFRAAIDRERRTLLEQAPVATALLTGPRHTFDLVNPGFCHLVERSAEQLLGKPCEDALPELRGSTPLRMLSRAFETGKTMAVPELMARLDRGSGPEERFFGFTIQPLQSPEGHIYGLMAVVIDITEVTHARKQVERTAREREHLLTDLRTASRAKDEFLAMLGHELRNPLSPIVTALSLLEEHEDEALRGPLAVISRQTEHLTRLVDDLLDVAKITQGKIELQSEPIDMADVLAIAADNASSLLESRAHHLELECPRATFYCLGDRVRLAQVFGNLLINAARYTQPHGRIRVSVEQQEETLRVRVQDDGKGIPTEMLPRIFNIFEQGQRTTDRAEGGLGLGLALVKSLAQLHGGAVHAESPGVDQGSTFTVTLPALTRERKEDVRVSFRQTPVQPITTQGKRVLVVDDNIDAGTLLAVVLRKAGHIAELATEPLKALEIAANFKPEVAVLDIGLPVIDGYELARRLQEVPGCENCMRIAVTGYGQTSDRERSVAAGFAHHLVKPVKTSALLSLVQVVPAETSVT